MASLNSWVGAIKLECKEKERVFLKIFFVELIDSLILSVAWSFLFMHFITNFKIAPF